MYKMQGVLFNVGTLQTFASGISKRRFIISNLDNGPYSNVTFEALGEDVAKIDQIKVGEAVEVSFEIHGKSFTREAEVRHYNSLRVRGIKVLPSSISTSNEIVVQQS